METPHQVIQAAAQYIEMFGRDFKYLGEYKGRGVWQFVLPEEQELGFPVVFLFKEGDTRAEMKTGPQVLQFIASFGVE